MEQLHLEEYCQDPSCTVETIVASVNRFQNNEITASRKTFSEYYHLFPILRKYNDKFQKYTRMTQEPFDYTLAKVDTHLQKNWCNFHQQAIIPEEKLVITMRLLATGASYSDLAFSFRMGESTVCNLVREVMQVLWEELYPLHMPIPTRDMFLKIARDFYSKWNLPHCIDAIDGCHIAIKKPPKSGKLYYNYKKFFSIVLQAVVDVQYKFICIDVDGYGYQHDATTYRNSTFYAALRNGIITIPEDTSFPILRLFFHFFVGDGAYPLSENLLKSYPEKELPQDKKIFNKRLSRERMVVECAFGKLFQKWRIFYKTIQQLPETIELIVKAACILHNVIIYIKEDSVTCEDESVTLGEENDTECNACETDIGTAGLGQEVREELTKYFIEHSL